MEALLCLVIHITCPSTMMTFHASIDSMSFGGRGTTSGGGGWVVLSSVDILLDCVFSPSPLFYLFDLRSQTNFFNYFSIWYNQEGCGERSIQSAPSQRQQGHGINTNQEAWRRHGGLMLPLCWMSRAGTGDAAHRRKDRDFWHLHCREESNVQN